MALASRFWSAFAREEDVGGGAELDADFAGAEGKALAGAQSRRGRRTSASCRSRVGGRRRFRLELATLILPVSRARFAVDGAGEVLAAHDLFTGGIGGRADLRSLLSSRIGSASRETGGSMAKGVALPLPLVGSWVPRLDAALEHRDHGRQGDPEVLVALGAVAARDDRPSSTSTMARVDDGPAELVGEPDPDLEVAAVGGVVAEQDQVVAAPAASWSRTTAAISRAMSAGPSAAGRPRRGWPRCSRPPARRAAARRLRRRRGSARSPPPVAAATWTASSTAHSSWLLIGEAGVPAVDGLGVLGQHDLAGGVRDPLDADQHVGMRSSDPLVGRVEQRRRVDRADGHGVELLHVGHGELGCRSTPARAAGRPAARACRATAPSRRW